MVPFSWLDPSTRDQRAHRNADASLDQDHDICSISPLPRDVVEMASLQAQLTALTLRLKQLKCARAINSDALLMYGSYWRMEAKDQSKQRAIAQLENERLKSQLQLHKQIALRFVNVMKRKPMSRTMQTLNRYEITARKRVKKLDAEFNHEFASIEADLAHPDLFGKCSDLEIIRTLQTGCRGFYIKVCRSRRLLCALVAASNAIWRFRPHEELRNHFIYEYIETTSGNTIGYTCRFRPKQSSPTWISCRAEFSQQLKHIAHDCVAIVWKIRIQTTESGLSVLGRGHHVIWSDNGSNGAKKTMLRSSSWFSSDSAINTVGLDEAQEDPHIQVVMEYLRRGFEFFTALTKELGAQNSART